MAAKIKAIDVATKKIEEDKLEISKEKEL